MDEERINEWGREALMAEKVAGFSTLGVIAIAGEMAAEVAAEETRAASIMRTSMQTFLLFRRVCLLSSCDCWEMGVS